MKRLAVACLLILAFHAEGTARGFFENLSRETGSCLSGGCDVVWKLNQRLDQGLSSKVASLTEPAKRAFMEAAKYLFEGQLNPFLTQVNNLTEARIAQVEKVFQDAITKAEKATANTIELVKADIILTASEEIKRIIDQALANVQCAVLFTEESAQRFLDRNFDIAQRFRELFGRDKCAPLSAADRYNPHTMYTARKCQYDIEIRSSKTVGELRTKYLDYLEFSSRSICLVVNPDVKASIVTQQSEYTKNYRLWLLATQ